MNITKKNTMLIYRLLRHQKSSMNVDAIDQKCVITIN